jgi:lysozyme family protein
MSTWTFEQTRDGYAKMWASCSPKGGKDATNADFYACKIIASELKYRSVQSKLGTPWFFVGALHMREAGCDFRGVLHNGENIIGTGRKTKLVPAGRGPFSTWEEAAIDALMIKGYDKIRDWSPARMGYEAERFNGFGYTARGVNSPYVWAGSNHEQTGKYVADHVWDKNFDDPQIGVMTVIMRLAALRPDIKATLDGLGQGFSPPVAPVVAPAPVVVPAPVVAPASPAPAAPVTATEVAKVSKESNGLLWTILKALFGK